MHKDEHDAEDKDNLLYNAEKYPLTSRIIRTSCTTGGSDWKLLDIGTYKAIFYAQYLPELLQGGEIYGVDINPDYIEVAKKRGVNMALMNLDTDPLPYDSSMFDFVVSDSVLEHTLRPREMFEEIARVLKPGGKVLISVPSAGTAQRRWRTLRGDNPFHPLIDNLVNRGYMKRCAVFYDTIDLKSVLGKDLILKEVYYINQPYHDPKTLMMKVLRLWGKFVPTVRDTMIAVAVKK